MRISRKICLEYQEFMSTMDPFGGMAHQKLLSAINKYLVIKSFETFTADERIAAAHLATSYQVDTSSGFTHKLKSDQYARAFIGLVGADVFMAKILAETAVDRRYSSQNKVYYPGFSDDERDIFINSGLVIDVGESFLNNNHFFCDSRNHPYSREYVLQHLKYMSHEYRIIAASQIGALLERPNFIFEDKNIDPLYQMKILSDAVRSLRFALQFVNQEEMKPYLVSSSLFAPAYNNNKLDSVAGVQHFLETTKV